MRTRGSMCGGVVPLLKFWYIISKIFHVTDSPSWWKHSSQILVPVDMTASHSFCTFVGYTSHFNIGDGYTMIIKERTWSTVTLEYIVMVKPCLVGSKDPKVWQNNVPYDLQRELLIQGRVAPCFHVVYVKFWAYHSNVTTDIKTHQTRQCFYSLLLSNFGEPVF